jgi:phage terminase large subunit
MIYSKPCQVKIKQHLPPLLTGPLFTKLETCTKRIIVCQGGGDAAKTVTILHWLAVKAIQKKETQISVVGIDVPNLKRGAMRAFKRYVGNNPQIKPFIKFFNKTDREYHFTNGSIISFISFEDDEDARGSEHDYVFMNEANLMSYNLFWELQRKCRKNIILDYNPTFSFWAHAKLINHGEAQFHGHVQMFIVDHRHNPFLTEEQHHSYESISDPEKFMVYARGMTGAITGQIFRFKKVDSIPENLPFGFGMDIGYTTDKTTIIKVYMNGKDHYYQELLYKSNDEIQNEINQGNLIDEHGNPQTVECYIKKILVDNGCTMSTNLWGDHDKSISTKLRRIGIPYRMAKKGPNSVAASISSVKRFNGFYYNSPNLENELKTYIWQTAVDMLTGNEVTVGEPVADVADHCIAGLRYFDHSYAMRFAG